MRIKALLIGTLVLLVNGCAQVPKEAVELSTTVGRDIAVTREAHVQLASLLFQKMKEDVNRFVDGIYAPHQIRAAMERQKELAESSDPNDKKISLLLAINAAFKPGASEKLQSATLKGMGILVTKIRNDVEQMRRDLLTPLDEQEKMVLGSINRAYQQMHYANSIVTGHLSSVAKVHEAQSELLAEFGVEKDLRKEIGEGMAAVSSKITLLVDAAENVDDKMVGAEKTATSLKDAITELGKVFADKQQEKKDD